MPIEGSRTRDDGRSTWRPPRLSETAPPPAALARHWEEAGVSERAHDCYLAAAALSRGHFAIREAIGWYRAALRTETVVTVRGVEARIQLSELLLESGQTSEAMVVGQEGLEEASRSGLTQLMGRALRSLGDCHRSGGRYPAAVAAYTRARSLAHELDLVSDFAICEHRLGIAAQAQGDLDAAIRHFEAGLEHIDEATNERLGCVLLANLATARNQQGAVDTAELLYRRALTGASSMGDLRTEGVIQGNLATLYHEQGRLEEATQLYRSALESARTIGDRAGEGRHLSNLGICLYQQDELGEAEELYEAARQISFEIEDRIGMGSIGVQLATLHRDQGKVDEAAMTCMDAVSVLETAGDPRLLGSARGTLSSLQLLRGKTDEAARHLERAVQGLQTVGDRLEIAKCWCHEGHLRLASDRSATEQLARIREVVRELNLGADSELGRMATDLTRAQQAQESGERLVRGYRPVDLPARLARWLEEASGDPR